jgi:protein-disulfide isomerase
MIRIVPVIFVSALITVPACAQQAAAPVAPGEAVVATLGGQPITARELEQEAAPRLLTLRQQEYQIKTEAIRELAFRRQLERAAASAGVSVDELMRREVTDKVTAPSEEEIAQVVQQYRSRLPADDEQAKTVVRQGLTQQRRQQREAAFREELLAKVELRILLEPPRAAVRLGGHEPTRGAAKAPVTVVEFSDFQCPYCARSQAVLQQIKATYGDKVRFVFKHLPLDMHRDARRAAEASLCAGDGGKFWELHDWMFANPNQLSEEQLVTQAAALGLDRERFTTCLTSGEKAEMVNADMKAASEMGITGTPAFVVNGRLIMGAQPFEAFKEVIEDELARAGAKTAARR